MLPPTIANQTITRYRAGRVDDHGLNVPDPDPANAVALTISGCSFQPGVGAEDTTNRDADQTIGVLYLPPGADIRDGDTVTVPGYPARLRLVGEPQRWATGLVLDHVVANVSIWEG